MGCRGVHFAIQPNEMQRLIDAADDSVRLEIIEEIEEAWEDGFHFETDKAWDAIHRSLTDGNLEWDNGVYPTKMAILGGESLCQTSDYIICLVKPECVADVAKSLEGVTKESLRAGYERIAPSDYQGEISNEDFEYTWESFVGLPAFFQAAHKAGRAVIFTTDQ